MKKIIILLLLLSMPINVYARSYLDMQLQESEKNEYYNTAKKLQGNENIFDIFADETICRQANMVKDPNLIHFAFYNQINEKDYNSKLAKDQEVYNKIKPKINKNGNPDAVNYYRVYRIAERIIRANKLDYVNWRIAIRKTPDQNADASNANYIRINTGLYDSLGDNDDALAYVLAHEMAHLVLGHGTRTTDIQNEFKRAKKEVRSADGLSYLGLVLQMNNLAKEQRTLEYMADAEGLTLIIKSGYSPQKAMETMNLLSAMDSNIHYVDDTHPSVKNRIENIKKSFIVADPNWIYIGKENIYNSNVLPCKKGSDHVSIIIPKSKNNKLGYYQVETGKERLVRIAYASYKNGHLDISKKYFKIWAKKEPENYIPYLYLSYINEINYKMLKHNKYLKRAKYTSKQANKYAPNSVDVQSQINDLNTIQML